MSDLFTYLQIVLLAIQIGLVGWMFLKLDEIRKLRRKMGL